MNNWYDMLNQTGEVMNEWILTIPVWVRVLFFIVVLSSVIIPIILKSLVVKV